MVTASRLKTGWLGLTLGSSPYLLHRMSPDWQILLQKSVEVGREQWFRTRTTLRGGGLR
jgi:hypothetical protein